MKLARSVDGQIQIGSPSEFFPNTSFATFGPNDAFLEEHACFRVHNSISFNPETQDIVEVEPYLDGNVVRTVAVSAISPQRLYDLVVQKTLDRLDAFAATRNYGSIISATTYATSTIPKFAAEGQRAVELRDQTWTTLYQILDEIQSGTRPIPTSYAEVEALLPVLSWEE